MLRPLLLLIVLLLVPLEAHAQTGTPLFPDTIAPAAPVPPSLPPLRELGRVESRPCINDVEVIGRFAYVVDTYYVRAVDLTNPRRPRPKRSSQRIPYANAVTRVGDVLYVSAGPTLRLFDVSRPGGLRDLGPLPLAQAAVGELHVRGSHGYVTADESVVVLDLSTPRTPRVVATMPIDSVVLYGVAIDGDRMYVPLARMVNGLAEHGYATDVYDLSQPASPRLLGRVLEGEHVWSLVVDRGVAYWTTMNEVRSADVRDLGGVRALARVPLGVSVGLLRVAGDRLFAGLEWVAVLDISSPASPRLVGGVDVDDSLRGVQVVGTTAYLAGHQSGGLRVVELR